jgi:hypothetical protein
MDEERNYHKRWSKVEETVTSPIEVAAAGSENEYLVTYTVSFRTENAEEWSSGHNEIALTIRDAESCLLITRQTAGIHDRQSGKQPNAKAGKITMRTTEKLKPVAITLPKPCWIATERASNDPTLEITDLFHFNGAGYRLHRTYRRISPDGVTVKASCRAEYDGTAQVNGNVIPVYFGQQKWGKGGDDALLHQVAKNATSVVGQTLELSIQPDGSLGRPGASPMKRVP